MTLGRFLAIFALGAALGIVAVSIFQAPRTAAPSLAPEGLEPTLLEQPEATPKQIADEPPVLSPWNVDSLEPAEFEDARPPARVPRAELWLEELQEGHSFDDEYLEAAGCFSLDDISWIRLRWEEFEDDKRELAERAARGELSPDGAEWAELRRTLRENLGELRYDGLLYATHQANGIQLSSLPTGSRAKEAGLHVGDRVLRYNGVRVSDPNALARLTRGEFLESFVEIDVRRVDGSFETIPIQPGSLGVRFQIWEQSPCPGHDEPRG